MVSLLVALLGDLVDGSQYMRVYKLYVAWCSSHQRCVSRAAIYPSQVPCVKFTSLFPSPSLRPVPVLTELPLPPGLCPDWSDWKPEDALKNATEAMGLADDWLNVPQVREKTASGLET